MVLKNDLALAGTVLVTPILDIGGGTGEGAWA